MGAAGSVGSMRSEQMKSSGRDWSEAGTMGTARGPGA